MVGSSLTHQLTSMRAGTYGQLPPCLVCCMQGKNPGQLWETLHLAASSEGCVPSVHKAGQDGNWLAMPLSTVFFQSKLEIHKSIRKQNNSLWRAAAHLSEWHLTSPTTEVYHPSLPLEHVPISIFLQVYTCSKSLFIVLLFSHKKQPQPQSKPKSVKHLLNMFELYKLTQYSLSLENIFHVNMLSLVMSAPVYKVGFGSVQIPCTSTQVQDKEGSVLSPLWSLASAFCCWQWCWGLNPGPCKCYLWALSNLSLEILSNFIFDLVFYKERSDGKWQPEQSNMDRKVYQLLSSWHF